MAIDTTAPCPGTRRRDSTLTGLHASLDVRCWPQLSGGCHWLLPRSCHLAAQPQVLAVAERADDGVVEDADVVTMGEAPA